MKRLLGGIVAVVIVAAMIWAVRSAGRRSVQVAPAARATVVAVVDEQGKTRLPQVHRVTMPFAGRIEAIALDPGDPVNRGYPVAQIAEEDLEAERDEARAAVARLDAAIVENEDTSLERLVRRQSEQLVESMDATVQAAENRLTAGEKRRAVAERQLQRIEPLAERGSVSQEELDEAELRAVEAQVGVRQDALVSEAVRAIRSAVALLPEAVTNYIDRKSLGTARIERERQEAAARLRQAELRSERGTMTSPIDGVVLERPVQNEGFLPAGELLLTIGDLDQLQVEAEVLSEDAVRVRAGQRARIYGTGALGGADEGLAGEVLQVEPAGFTRRSSLGVDQQRVNVVVALPEATRQRLREAGVGVEYRVRVEIETGRAEEVIAVPRSALFRAPDGTWQVFVVRGGTAVRTPVRVGLSGDSDAEILDGLNAGDRVILAPDNDLVDGARVRVEGPG